MEIYEKFKELREDRDLTQKEIAQILNTSTQYYQKYEKGIRPIPAAHIKTLCLCAILVISVILRISPYVFVICA